MHLPLIEESGASGGVMTLQFFQDRVEKGDDFDLNYRRIGALGMNCILRIDVSSPKSFDSIENSVYRPEETT